MLATRVGICHGTIPLATSDETPDWKLRYKCYVTAFILKQLVVQFMKMTHEVELPNYRTCHQIH